MKLKALIANDDMEVHQLLHDLIEINYRNIVIERALSSKSFWTKVSAPENGYNLIFLSSDYIKEEPDGFMERLRAASPGAPGRVIVIGEKAGLAECGEEAKQFAFLEKPFSMEEFEEVAKAVCG